MGGWPPANEMVQWTISSEERGELERAAGEQLKQTPHPCGHDLEF
jgi:hypothetical protein